MGSLRNVKCYFDSINNHTGMANLPLLLQHDLINLRKLEYVQTTETDTMYRFNCHDADDRNFGLCKLLDKKVDDCDCSKEDPIQFTYNGEEVSKNHKFANAVVTGRLESKDKQWFPYIELDQIENFVEPEGMTYKEKTKHKKVETNQGGVGRRRRLLQSGQANGC